jgi:3-hydroxybutyryl-CoA dehydrogenase
MSEQTVGVLGCGTMGSGIAQVAAGAGCAVVVLEVDDPAVEAGLGRIERSLAEGARRGKLTEDEQAATRERIRGTTRRQDLSDCDIVIEAIVENLPAKQEAMRSLADVLAPEALVATNTSCLSVTEIAAAYAHPGRVVGLHFFNPAQVMKLVEVVRAVETSDEAFDRAYDFVVALGKEPIRTKDSPGFLVNRLLIPYMNQAIQAYDDGLSSLEEIDTAVELGLGYPMGPFKLADLVGLDVALFASEAVYADTHREELAPPPLLRRMVRAGRLGRKTGRGFYRYDQESDREARGAG